MLRSVAGLVRLIALDLARAAATVELLATPAALLEIHAGQMLVRCGCCRQAIRVVLPGDLWRIAEVLAARSDPTTRTWQAHESVADLERENHEHGAPVPIRSHPPAETDTRAQEGGTG